MPDARPISMRKPAEPASTIVQSLQAEHAALAAHDAVWIDELDERRRKLAAYCAQLLEDVRRAAIG
jgi:hypothetical protein